jgi:hypothetical protein
MNLIFSFKTSMERVTELFVVKSTGVPMPVKSLPPPAVGREDVERSAGTIVVVAQVSARYSPGMSKQVWTSKQLLQYPLNGTTWLTVPNVSETGALLLGPTA